MNLAAKKLFLLDMDGTIYLGKRLFDGTEDFLCFVKRIGGRALFLTNNSSKSVDAYVAHLHSFGLPAGQDDFLTSVNAAVAYLKRNFDDPLIYAFGTETFRQQLQNAGFRVTTKPREEVTVLLCGFDTELTFQKLEDACRLLRRGVDFIATNPDWVCPTEWGSVPDCGSVCEMLTRATGRKPVFIGKPQPAMAELAVERYGFTKEQTLLVGDRIYTDIACGVNAGIDTCFVLSGEGVPEDIERYGISPTITLKNIRELLNTLEDSYETQ